MQPGQPGQPARVQMLGSVKPWALLHIDVQLGLSYNQFFGMRDRFSRGCL